MTSSGEAENVRVAVRVRPLNTAELESRCRAVATKTPAQPHLMLGERHQFTFDDVFASEVGQDVIFDECVRPLIDSSLEGRNATVLAYGQTGSGKTFTMGTGFEVGLLPEQVGILPRAAQYLFTTCEQSHREAEAAGRPPPEYKISVSFVEVYQDKYYDLFDNSPGLKQEANIRIRDERREDGSMTIAVTGAKQCDAQTVDEVMDLLHRGSLARATAGTMMNARSSRSHAIFTMYITHRRAMSVPAHQATILSEGDHLPDAPQEGDENGVPQAGGDASLAASTTDIITTTSKFNFVDLAGSERLKRTMAQGQRQKEGININTGLFALGNVISALGDPERKGVHVPYRSNKLTRILQDSLGGNSRTVMVACISPSDKDFMETLNTLKYANRARNIQNKVVVNQDSASREIQFLRETIQKLNLELAEFRAGRRPLNPDSEEANDLYHELNHLRERNGALTKQLTHLKAENEALRAHSTSELIAQLRSGKFVNDDDSVDDASREEAGAVMAAGGDNNGAVLTADANGEVQTSNVPSGNKENQPLLERLAKQNIELTARLHALEATGINAVPLSPLLERATSAMSVGTVRPPSALSSTAGARPTSSLHRFNAEMRERIKTSADLVERFRLTLSPHKHGRRTLAVEDEDEEAEAGDGTEHETDHGSGVDDDLGAGTADDDEEEEEEEETIFEGDDAAELLESTEVSERDSRAETGGDSDMRSHKASAAGLKENLAERAGSSGGGSGEEDDEEHEDADEDGGSAVHQDAQYGSSVDANELLNELSVQISIQEQLLAQLSNAENELEKQKELYEARLLQEKQERDRVMEERDRLRGRLVELADKPSEEAKSLRVEYERQLRDVHAKLGKMEKARLAKERMEADRHRAQTQIDILKKSIADAKAQRTQIMQQAHEDMRKNREREKEQSNEIHKLRLAKMKAKNEASRWERAAKGAEAKVVRMQDEVKRLRDKVIDAEAALKRPATSKGGIISSAKRVMSGTRSNRPETPTREIREDDSQSGSPWRRLKRRSSTLRQSDLGVQRKRTLLEREVQRAIMYQNTKARIETLIDKRDHQLQDARNKYRQELEKALKLEGPDSVKVRELREELERVETETDYIIETIREEQESLIGMETSGIRSCLDQDDLSESGDKLIMDATLKEARILLKSLFTALVRKELASERTRVRVKELEIETESKNAILKSLAASGSGSTPKPDAPSAQSSAIPVAILGATRGRMGSAGSDAERPRAFSDAAADSSRTRTRAAAATAGVSAASAHDDGTLASKKAAAGLPGKQRASSSKSLIARGTGRRVPTEGTDAPSVHEAAGAHSAFQDTLRRSARRQPVPVRATVEAIVAERRPTAARRPQAIVNTYTVQGHEDEVLCVALFESRLLTGSKDRTVRVWDLATNKLVASLPDHEGHVAAVAHIPSQFFSACKNIVRVWDARTCEPVSRLSLKKKEPVTAIRVQADGSTIYIAAGKYLRIWDLKLEREIKVVNFKGKIDSLALNDDSDLLALCTMDRRVRIFDISRLSMDVLDCQVLEPPHYKRVHGLCWADNVLFSASDELSIKKWTYNKTKWENTKTASAMQGGKPNESIAVASLCALGSRYLVSASVKGVLKIWDAETCQPVEEHTQHEERVSDLALSGGTLMSASSDRTVKVWEIQPFVMAHDLELARKAEAVAGAIAAASAGTAAAQSTFTMQATSDDVGNRTFDKATAQSSAAALPTPANRVASDRTQPMQANGASQQQGGVTYPILDGLPRPLTPPARTVQPAGTAQRFVNEV